jgi:vacuolar-type H+-ATPase subunit F/Vma7
MTEKEIILVGDEDTVQGFKLAGVKRTHVINEENKDEVYDKIREEKAVILLSEEAESLLGERVEELRENTVVQVVPLKPGEYAVINELIRDTVGFDLTEK